MLEADQSDDPSARQMGTATIGDSKHADVPLCEQERHLALALGAGRLGMWEWEIATDRVHWSPECFAVMGTAETQFGGLREDFTRILHPDDAPHVWASVGEALAGGHPYESSFRIVRPDGSVRWVNSRGTVVRDEAGTPQRLLGVVVDMTGEQEAEEALRESERKYRRLHDSMRDAFVMVDLEGRIQECNAAFREMLGYSDEELRRLTYRDITPSHWHQMEARIVAEQILPRGSSDIYEKEYRRQDGRVIPVELRTFLLCDHSGRPHGMWAIVRDITERKQGQAALLESEQRFRAFVTASSNVVYRMNPDWSELHHLEGKALVPDTTIPSGTWLEKYIHADDQPHVLKAIRDAIQTKEPVDLEHRVLRADGTLGWAHSRAVPLLDGNGDIVEWFGAAADITARKQIEEALDIARTRLEAALEASQVVLFNQDRDLRYTWIHNPALGYKAGEVVGTRDGDLFQRAEDAAHTEAIKRTVMETACARREEVCIVQDATVHFYDLVVQPDFNAAGEIVGVKGAALDISERKRTEEALRVAGDSFRQLVEQSPFGVFAVDADFRLVMVSAGAQKVFRHVRPLLRRDFEDVLRILWAEPFVSEALQHFRHTLATGTPYHAPRMVERRADIGETEAYDWRVERVVLPDGRPGVVCHFYDLSERQRYEADLRASELRYRTLLDATGAVTWTCPPSGLHVDPQPSWMAFTGQSAEEVRGDGWANAVHPDDAAALASRWKDAVARGVSLVDDAHRVRRHDGAWRWMQVTAAPIRDANGAIVEWFGATVDITDRKAIEERLREADRQKDQFVAILAHELRNPLAPIRSALALLKMRQVTDPVLSHSRDVMERQVAHMARLLDDLLDATRLSRGTLTLQPSVVPLRDVLAAAVETALPLIEQRAQALVVEGVDGSMAIDGDPARLIQVFGNLLTNAANYSSSQATIKVEVGVDGDAVVVAVRDTGGGIAADHLESIFGLFSRVGAMDQTNAAGLGIGLALVKHLVELHGGTVVASSDGPGLGSTFTVRLPAARIVATPCVGEASTSASTPVSRRVLIADDNVDAADTLALLLEALGCEVRTVYGGEAAVREAEAFRPDVALLDLGMPDLDGREACRRIRLQPWGAGMTMVALTGWGREDDRQGTHLAGFDRHVVKPADPEVLVQLIRQSS